jgi:hypothetical protein
MDQSIYEAQNEDRQSISNAIAFGRITRVFPERRACEVKTFFGKGAADDNHIPNCQWINLDGHPDGDESAVIPRVGSFGFVFYIDGEPFFFGFMRPLAANGSAETGEILEPLNEGDRVLKTIGKNRIIMRAHGEIQIESTRTCRTIYFPDFNLINTLCRNYEFRTDGGTVDWKNDGNNNTLSRQEWRDTLERANIIVEEKGRVSGEILWREQIGLGGTNLAPSSVVYTRTVKNTGETELFIRAPDAPSGHNLKILPDGQTDLNIADKTSVQIKPTGEVTLDVGPGNAVLNIKPDGSVSLTTKSTIDATADKDISMTTKANMSATVGGNLDANVTGNLSAQCAKATIKANSNVFTGGAVTDNTINNDPITGIPLNGVGGVDLV